MNQQDELDQLITVLIYTLGVLRKEYDEGKLSKRDTYVRLLAILANVTTMLLNPPDPQLQEIANNIKTGRKITDWGA